MTATTKQYSAQKPTKSLVTLLKKHAGRDGTGQVSISHRGHRQKRYYRQIDFKRDKLEMTANVVSVEYDPNRNAHISLVRYTDGEVRYIINAVGLNIGDTVSSSATAPIKVGNCLPLSKIPTGIEIHNLEIHPGQGAKLIRSAGAFATIVAHDKGKAQVKLNSGEVKLFSDQVRATIGRVSNIVHKDEIIGKAGRKILMGIRPTVRGTAQNPRSHPHGGGEGRSGEGMHPKTPWGKPARGVRTRNKRKWTKSLIISARPR